jgi:hypothetical protein
VGTAESSRARIPALSPSPPVVGSHAELLFGLRRREDLAVMGGMLNPFARAEARAHAQVLLDHHGTWVAEYRDGDADHHFQALTPDRELVEAFLTGWLLDRPGWRDGLAWRPIALG